MKLGLNSISIWFGMIMILVLVSGAAAITFTDVMSERLYGPKRIFFILLLLSYSVYRGFRIYYLLKRNKDEG
jgi:hypothetical protein